MEVPLKSIRVGDDGTDSSTIKDTSVTQLFTAGKERYVNVATKAEGGEFRQESPVLTSPQHPLAAPWAKTPLEVGSILLSSLKAKEEHRL